MTERLLARLFERGVIVEDAGHFANCIRLMPPLTMTRETMDKALEIFEDVVKEEGTELS